VAGPVWDSNPPVGEAVDPAVVCGSSVDVGGLVLIVGGRDDRGDAGTGLDRSGVGSAVGPGRGCSDGEPDGVGPGAEAGALPPGR